MSFFRLIQRFYQMLFFGRKKTFLNLDPSLQKLTGCYLLIQTLWLSLFGDKRIWLLIPLQGRPFLVLVSNFLIYYLFVLPILLLMK